MIQNPEPPPFSQRLQEIAGSVSSVVAPISLISAILFYFGYVYTTTEYGYFGLDVDTIGLSTQEFIMRSPGPLLTPLLAAGLVAAAVSVVHAAVRRRIEVATAEAPWRLRQFRRLARWCNVFGWTVLGVGAILVFGFAALGPLVPLYILVAPSVLAIGAAVSIYAVRLDRLLARPRRGAVIVALYAVLATSLLWTTSTLAQYTGRWAAITLVAELQDRPSVVLDTKEHLFLPTTAVQEYALPKGENQVFHFRYANLRLLIQGKDQMFLVPGPWRRGDPTLVVPVDGDVRVQFQSG
ncbi:MAG: hypothetical protein H0X35_02770 [Pseudonocardiales bacterium]|nr:hypothetical protein [Pseudonocardiales bacterium]